MVDDPASLDADAGGDESSGALVPGWRSTVLLLARGARLGLRTRYFVPASLGVLLTFVGWWCIAWLFSGTDDPALQAELRAYRGCPFEACAMTVQPASANLGVAQFFDKLGIDDPGLMRDLRAPQVRPPCVWTQLSAPVRQAFRSDVTFQGLAFSILAGLWGIAVWGLFGGLLARLAALELGHEEKISWSQGFAHAMRKWPASVAAPLLPLIGVLLVVVPMALVALIGRTGVGLFLLGVIWPLYLLGGVLMAIFVVGVWLGWPLMIAAVSTESSDSFDALSRSYSYLFQRPLHLLGYVIVAAVFNVLAIVVALAFSEAVVYLTGWGASWGAGGSVLDLAGQPSWGSRMIGFWNGVVRLLAGGAVYSTFWGSMTAIYLLLRRDVDGTELDEVFVEESAEPYGLPKLQTGPTGDAGA